MVRKIQKVIVRRVSRVALVDEAANLVPGLYKSADGNVLNLLPNVRVDAEEGLLYGIVQAPWMVDAHSHFMDEDGPRIACHSYSEDGMQMDIMHGSTVLGKEKARVVENMMLPGFDARFPKYDNMGREINHKGAWAAVVKIDDPNLRALAKSGSLSEFSLEAKPGDYELVEATPEELALTKSKGAPAAPETITSTSTSPLAEDSDMTPEQLKELVAQISEATTKALHATMAAEKAEAEKAAAEAAEAASKAKTEEKFDPTDLPALQKRRTQAKLNDLMLAWEIDPADPEPGITSLSSDDLETYAREVAEIKGTSAGGAGGSRRTPLKKRRQTEQVEFNDADSWDVGGEDPLAKELREAHARATNRRGKRTS